MKRRIHLEDLPVGKAVQDGTRKLRPMVCGRAILLADGFVGLAAPGYETGDFGFLFGPRVGLKFGLERCGAIFIGLRQVQ